MSINIDQFIGWLDSEHQIATAGTDHVAGQPAKLTTTGMQLALLPKDVIGIFYNDMVLEVAGGPSAVDAAASGFTPSSVLMGGSNKITISPGVLKTGAVQTAYVFPPTNSPWAVGQHIFLNASGFWDNAPANTNDPPFGVVTKPPATSTDTMQVVLYSMAPFYSSVTT